jgi:hypothetical protein
MDQVPNSPERFRNRIAMAAGSTLIIWFFSEMFFLNESELFYAYSRLPVFSDLLIFITDFLIVFLLFYGLFTLWLLIPIHLFRVRSIWALFLAGALCGWAIEGILPIMYAEMPGALLWPAGSWHVLVNVILGWYLLRKLLEKNRHLLTLIVFGALGLFWGFWGTWFWPLEGIGTIEEFTAPLTPADFTFFSLSSTFLLALGYYLLDRFAGTSFTPAKGEIWLWAGISALGLIFLAQFYALIFCVLVGIVMLILRRNKNFETREPIFNAFTPGIQFTNFLLIFVMPVMANLTYPFYLANNISANKYIGLILFPIILASAGMFFVSAAMILRMKKKAPAAIESGGSSG